MLTAGFTNAQQLDVMPTDPAQVNQSVLNPAGAQANHIAHLWWPTLYTLAAIYIVTVLFMVIPALLRRGASTASSPDVVLNQRREYRLGTFVTIATAISIVILFIILIGDFSTGNRVRGLSGASDPITINVTGHQWWWEITYADPLPYRWITDANEIHIPVGKPIRINLTSNDVIHSFWVPNLAPKKDLVPGRSTSIWIQGDKPGIYWGQCAEFCGFQHAHMRFAVVVEQENQYNQWREAAVHSANDPINDIQQRGKNVFMVQTCSMCHGIAGTDARGRIGPDLSHVASRLTLAAGTLPNSMGHLAGWIIDPQSIKPGVAMPQHALSGEDLQALLEYLENLK